VVSIGKPLNDAVNLLRFFGEVNLHQQFTGGHVEWFTEERKLAHVASHDVVKEFVLAFGQKCWDLRSVHKQLDTFKVLNGCLAVVALGKRYSLSAEA